MATIDFQKLIDGDIDFERRRDLIDAQFPVYVERYPRQWLALGDGDVWVLAASLEALVQALDAKGLSRATALIRFLNPDPVKLVL